MDEEKIIKHEKTLNELQQAVKHIRRASDITTCELCLRDLTLVEAVLQNLISIINELIEKNKEGKKERGKIK